MQMNAVVLSALALAADATSVAYAQQSEPTVADLRSLVADLQDQVDNLKAQNDQNWMTEKRAAEIRGLVQDVLADADTRASLLQSGAVAGYDKNFFISSADGNWLLKVTGQVQVRFNFNIQDSATEDNYRYG